MNNINHQALINDCLKEAFILQGKLLSLKEEKSSVISRVEKAKKWLAKQPDFVNFIQHLQSILHQNNIGAFSELLSYFVRDVLKKDKDIILDLYTYHNLPALKIEAINNGFRENIYEGNGGSVANIVSTGLRLIALSRMTNRKFIILDEPDCWLKPEHVPLFATIIGEISQKLNIQTVIISHHHWSNFKDFGRVIDLKIEGPHLTTEIIHDTPYEPLKNNNVINKIILKKLMSHYDTHYELHPHLTCITGENDIGKSVLATALKAVAYADSSDSYIMHNESEAQIIIEFDNKQVLWQRVLKTTEDFPQKVKFSLYENNNLIASEFSAHNTPTFIQDTLNISVVEDIDIHIGNQKQPVFLLSSDVKPQERAKILSLGKESIIIQKIMENIKDLTRQNKHIVKEGEERFNYIERQLAVLSNIDSIANKCEDLKTNFFVFEQQKEKEKELFLFLEDYNKYTLSNSIEKIENTSITEPNIFDLTDLIYLLNDYEIVKQINDIESIKHIKDDYTVSNTTELNNIILSLDKSILFNEITLVDNIKHDYIVFNTEELNKITNLLDKLSHFDFTLFNINSNNIELNNVNDLKSLISSFTENNTNLNDLNNKVLDLNHLNTLNNNEMEALLETVNFVCPTCQQQISKENFLGHH